MWNKMQCDGIGGLISVSFPFLVSDVVRRHVVRGTWFASGLIDGDLLPTFSNRSLGVSNDTPNGQCMAVGRACIVVRDITLTNGVLHVIDQLAIN